MKKLLTFCLILLSLASSCQRNFPDISWQKVDTGLYIAHYESPLKSILGDSKITILKIDPGFYKMNLYSERNEGWKERTIRDWALDRGMIAVINAGMFQGDGRNCGYMRNADYVNNDHFNSGNAMLAFDPMDAGLPAVQIIDRQCQDWETLSAKYRCLTQSIRMVDCTQNNCWAVQEKMWSMVVIGMDFNGNVLFVFCRSPYTVHDFIDTLLDAPIYLYNCMYLEGGPEASFYLNHNGTHLEMVGSYETDFYENDGNDVLWTVPNVIGIEKIVGL